jgi:hypothetical protein
VEGRVELPIFTLVSCLAYSSALKMEGWHIAPKSQVTFKGLQGIILQKTELFKYYYFVL